MSDAHKDYVSKLKDPNSTTREIQKSLKLYLRSLLDKQRLYNKKRGGQVVESIYKNGCRASVRQQIMKPGKKKKKKKPKLGTGKRFKNLSSKLKKKGAKNPKALAAWIGRKKFGKKKMSAMAAKGKKRRS